MSTKSIGDLGEDQAAKYLEKNDYKVIKRNFRTRFGEIDIVASDGKDLVFVEVKMKKSDAFGLPAEMVTSKKLKKIVNTAQIYITENEYKGSWRIDVVTILGDKIELLKNVTV